MLKLSDLALRPDFQIGPMLVSPSRRLVEGPGGFVHVEPLIMQVFLLLLDGGGKVVTRNELFDQVWGGVYVGDDSLNRAIAKVRRIGAQVAPGLYEIETIPRTGYRLTGEILDRLGNDVEDTAPDAKRRVGMSRRELAVAGAGVLAVGGIGAWAIWVSPARRFDALVRSSEEAIRKMNNDDQTVRDLQEAVSLRPDSAKALGLLAFVKSIGTASANPKIAEPALKEAQEAARKALEVDPREPYALLAMYELQGSTLDWTTRDQRLRQIIAIDPTHVSAIAELVLLTQAAGLNRESWNWNERAIQLEPFSFDFLSKRALKHWIAGRTAEADKVIDQVMALYPTNPWPRWVRFLIYAMTGRPRAAQAVAGGKPEVLGPEELAVWGSALVALDQHSPDTIAKAREACIKAAGLAGSSSVATVMIMSALGEVDAAFDIANGFLLSRGLIVPKGENRPKDGLNDATWRINTQWLFTPPCKIMRADARFLALCEGIGLTEYWRRRGVKPDFLLAPNA